MNLQFSTLHNFYLGIYIKSWSRWQTFGNLKLVIFLSLFNHDITFSALLNSVSCRILHPQDMCTIKWATITFFFAFSHNSLSFFLSLINIVRLRMIRLVSWCIFDLRISSFKKFLLSLFYISFYALYIFFFTISIKGLT